MVSIFHELIVELANMIYIDTPKQQSILSGESILNSQPSNNPCSGIASWNQINFHQGTSICSLLRCYQVAAQLKFPAAVRDQTALSLYLS